jgi:hypothetical protein
MEKATACWAQNQKIAHRWRILACGSRPRKQVMVTIPKTNFALTILRGIWLTTSIPKSTESVRVSHSAPVQVWINGTPILRHDSGVRDYQNFVILPQAAQSLRLEKNRIALHTRVIGPRPQGRAVIDVGLIAER